MGKGYAVQRIYTTPFSANPTTYSWHPCRLTRKPGFSWTGNGTDIVSAVNAGNRVALPPRPRQLVRLRRPWFWRHPGGQHLVTDNRHPVVFSINCASGIFDNETVDPLANKVGSGYGPSPGHLWRVLENFVRRSTARSP